ncbi:MAG TPA: SUMF1/EgtB/PvdO family nonheme iron enzyme [Bryobacteraceae bacterium]|nr:SUMF1/EgtB/PvdO family nonheme iron enzyme [Bryobacteraceae bacterium]
MASAGIIQRSESRRAELATAREISDRLFRMLSPEAFYARPIPERNRLIFYLGHLEAFDWNVLAVRGMSESRFHPEFDRLFERGIDPEPGKANTDSPGDWPSRSEVERYGMKTREWVDVHWDDLDPWWQQMVIEHRYMHIETLAYLLHALPYDQKTADRVDSFVWRPAPANPMIDIDAGTATLGKNLDSFGWDNEHLAHDVDVAAFRMSKFKNSNGEYLEFVREGGAAPHFWAREGDRWFWRGMFAQMPLPLNRAVWVTWDQATAYAKWRGAALPSEAQFLRACSLSAPDPQRDNFGYHHWDPIAVDAGHETANGGAPVQLIGNGWEWTRDAFAPFQGFEAHPFYPPYSSDFFDGEHYVMKGGSPRTAAMLTRPSFRNWFRHDYPYVFAGFRIVEG